MHDYEYDIFISYRRLDKDWDRWARKHVAGVLKTHLQPALGEPKIFIDDQIQTGDSWPARLSYALARSRLLVPLLCPAYFMSDWCQLELFLMCERERLCGLRCISNPAVLILPFVFNDGDSFPAEVKAMQSKVIHDATPFIVRDTPKFLEFSETLRQECPRIQAALKKVPPFDPAWETITHDRFRKRFQIQTATHQKTAPSLSLSPLK
ncbi:MAG: TIR domain-containing protein [Candidatus Kentron sp. G]|nr:MAG: TIR domain-containing protein [Candidatus Kentron sp. G]VFM96149.1 MAG: TIR domain-containing protein [Candidatus Kentron sp. G]VFM97584.1 MAG: TIR domain-containing protein [Candidatus Kentron sp. G]